MDPLSSLGAVTSLIGLGVQAFGGFSASADAQKAYGIQSNITGLESQLEDKRHTAMELSARRQSMEVLRNNQRMRAMATNAAVSQGAQYGSGLQGGLAQVDNQSAFNLAGINQNLQIGEEMFGINKNISGQKMMLSQTQSEMAKDQGIASLGGAITKVGPAFGSLGQTFGSSKPNLFGWGMGGGSPSGY